MKSRAIAIAADMRRTYAMSASCGGTSTAEPRPWACCGSARSDSCPAPNHAAAVAASAAKDVSMRHGPPGSRSTAAATCQVRAPRASQADRDPSTAPLTEPSGRARQVTWWRSARKRKAVSQARTDASCCESQPRGPPRPPTTAGRAAAESCCSNMGTDTLTENLFCSAVTIRGPLWCYPSVHVDPFAAGSRWCPRLARCSPSCSGLCAGRPAARPARGSYPAEVRGPGLKAQDADTDQETPHRTRAGRGFSHPCFIIVDRIEE